MTTLPPGWAYAPFSDVISIDSDLVDPRLSPSAYHIAPNHIESGTGRLLPFTTVAEDGVTSPKHRFSPGQILYSKIRPYLAKAVLVDFAGLCSADMYPLSTPLEPRFVHRWLVSDAFTQRVSQDQGRTVLPKVNQAALAKVMVPVPPLAEQKRIADMVEGALRRSRRAKEALDAVPPLLDKLRQSILAAAFRGDLTADWRAKNPNVEPADQLLARIRTERRARWEAAELAKMQAKGKVPRDERWKEKYETPEIAAAGEWELPDGWGWATVDELGCRIDYGSSAKTRDGEGGVPVLRMGNIFEGELRFEDLKYLDADHPEFPELLLESGDILFNRTNSAELVGKTAVYAGELPQCSFASYLLRVRLCSGYEPRLLSHYINSPLGRAWVSRVVAQQVGQANVNGTKLRALRVPVPPLAEQVEILARVSKLLDASLAVRRSVAEDLSRLDQSILAKAFRGELVPQDPTDEPASVLLDRIRAARQSSAPAKPTRGRKPKASAEASAPKPKQAPKPEPAQQQLALELTSSVLQAAVFPALWPRGPLDKDTAVRTLAEHLREAGLVEFKRLRADGPLYKQLLAAIESAVKSGELDRPRRGHVRACKHEASAYTTDDWRQVLLAALGAEPVHQEDAVRQAAEWARDNLGLEFSRIKADGHIAKGLHAAITSAIRQGLIERDGPRRIKLAGG